jgi:tetratricopeptide (TPR) repeat protein
MAFRIGIENHRRPSGALPQPAEIRSKADGRLAAALSLLEQLRPAIRRGGRQAQVDIARQLIAMRAPLGGQWRQLAQLAAGHGELGLAREAIDLFVEASDGSPAARYQKAALLFDLGAWAEIDALLSELPDDVPDPISNAYSRGLTALNLGKSAEARRYLERVTQLRPQAGPAWLALAMSVDLAGEPMLADRIIAAEHGVHNAKPVDQAPYYYALGKAHADRGEHALAFAAFARGARRMKAFAKHDRDRDRAEAAEAVRDYSAERIEAIAGRQDQPTDRTIFVTGLPRSGTTLVEQMLTGHSSVCGGAETSGLTLLARDVGGRSHAALARYAEVAGVAPAARLWDHWLDQRFREPGRVVDKSIDTSRFLGLAAALLPEAPVIWLTRDPLDRAWSCFRTNFLGGAIPWSYDLEDIAAHFRLEDGLLARWLDILGDRLLVVPYEALVAQPDHWVRRILAHCGLAEEAQVFAPEKNLRPVPTASMMQVRRPINRAAVGSARPYRPFLEPFIEAYYG